MVCPTSFKDDLEGLVKNSIVKYLRVTCLLGAVTGCIFFAASIYTIMIRFVLRLREKRD